MRLLLTLACLGVAAFVVDHARADEAEKKGKKALAFKLKDTDGKLLDSASLKDKFVVLEWIEPACPTCKRHARENSVNHLVKKYAKKKDVVILGICTSNPFTPWWGQDFVTPAYPFDGRLR